MDNTAKGFAQRILGELEGIKGLIHAAISSPAQQRRSLQGETSQPVGSQGEAEPQINSSPAPSTVSDAAPQKEPRFPRLSEWKPVFEVVGLMFLIAYTTIAAFQWCAMNRAVTAAHEQTRISARPWIGLTDEGEAIKTTPIIFDKGGNATIGYMVTTRNYSSSAAQNIHAMAFLLVTEDLPALNAKQSESCGDGYVGKKEFGFVLFSGRERTFDSSGSLFERRFMVSRNPAGTFQAWLVGCIGYRDQFNVLYHTKFIYRFVDPKTRVPIDLDASPNTSVQGEFIAYHTSLD